MRKTVLLMTVLVLAAVPGCTKKAAEVYKSPFFDPDPNAKPPPERTGHGGYN
jgi:hypothetical protein